MRRAEDFVPLLLVGPSGSGKSTLAGKLLGEFSELTASISYTTRAPRGTEENGKAYHFIDRATFVSMIERNEFLEWAEVHGQLYGTARGPVDAARASKGGMVFDVDFQGARAIYARLQDVVGVFVLPPSLEELERRLRARGTDSEEVIAKRLSKARVELGHYAMFDYLLVNDRLDQSCDQVRGIYLAERARRRGAALHAERLLQGSIPKV